MTAASSEFVTHCLELLGALGPARARRMFGGHGLYVDERFIALIIGETLYLKTDDETRPRFEAAGSVPFDYATRDGQRVVMAYWAAPQDAMESPALMLPWARLAMASALRAALVNSDWANCPAPVAAFGNATLYPPWFIRRGAVTVVR